jgi:ligand-binding SRPBCC domain-containing protein
MAVYERETRVRASFEAVWEFHATIGGLEALTPGWMNLRVESVVGPDGRPDPEVLEPGSRIRMSMRPFDAGPRQRWVSEITARENRGDVAYFRDEMVDGPFREWEHTHLFYRDGGETLVRDRVAYESPLRPADPLLRVGFEPMFRYRHRRTRELLEGAGGRETGGR